MTESHPIPALAKTAASLVIQNFQRAVNEIANQTREAMGLPDDPAWNCNFDTGMISREVPDPPTKDDTA